VDDPGHTAPPLVSLRPVTEDDLPIFFEHQRDQIAVDMAAFPARDLETHTAHWHRSLRQAGTVARTILFESEPVGHVVSWLQDDRRLVGYWIAGSHWGRGIASDALGQFLDIVTLRPLRAIVAEHNRGSARVLEKHGFTVEKRVPGGDVDEFILT
jgi:RimJ/RimL family protein N-acetyltransferase